jgi:DNA repair protein RadA/Sms
MARERSTYRCQECGLAAPKPGTCPDCARVGTYVQLVEERIAPARGPAARPSVGATRPQPIGEIRIDGGGHRTSTGMAELDRVLGGGVVTGSLVLIGGDPGIGKSTLLLQVSRLLAERAGPVLYVSGEESAAQVKMRADRLGPAPAGLYFVAETDLQTVEAHVAALAPRILIVDSIQTVYLPGLESAPGSVSQVRECGARLMALAKGRGVATFLVGHVTKEGAIAGPRVLEHLVDCVLQFEGERERTYRTVRAVKNRFGSTNEAGVFEMRDDGLVEVLDASARFVAEATRAPGSVILCAMEGSRPLLVEVQALVSQSELVPPRRVVAGLDRNRLALGLAVLGRHAGIGLGAADVFVNVVGGVRVDEPGSDLAVALAVAGAARAVALRGDDSRPLACFGELGLTGELRTVAHGERRIAEAARFGLAPVLQPHAQLTLKAALAAALSGARATPVAA